MGRRRGTGERRPQSVTSRVRGSDALYALCDLADRCPHGVIASEVATTLTGVLRGRGLLRGGEKVPTVAATRKLRELERAGLAVLNGTWLPTDRGRACERAYSSADVVRGGEFRPNSELQREGLVTFDENMALR